MRPTVTLSPVKPQNEAGRRTDPPVSVPIAQGALRAATPTPGPLLEPPGVRAVLASQGFQGVPICWLVPQPPMANSTVCVLPSTIMPCAIMRLAIVAVTVERRRRRLAEPPTGISPSRTITAFRAIGTPCSCPTAGPELVFLSTGLFRPAEL